MPYQGQNILFGNFLCVLVSLCNNRSYGEINDANLVQPTIWGLPCMNISIPKLKLFSGQSFTQIGSMGLRQPCQPAFLE
jgi:hypothetical protein